MDMMAVDLAPIPAAGIGSEVTLWGHASQGSVLPIDEVARAAGTSVFHGARVAPRGGTPRSHKSVAGLV
jgi:alanine racemase